MKIIITDSGLFWNPWNPVLKKYKDFVTVVWLSGTILMMNITALSARKNTLDLV